MEFAHSTTTLPLTHSFAVTKPVNSLCILIRHLQSYARPRSLLELWSHLSWLSEHPHQVNFCDLGQLSNGFGIYSKSGGEAQTHLNHILNHDICQFICLCGRGYRAAVSRSRPIPKVELWLQSGGSGRGLGTSVTDKSLLWLSRPLQCALCIEMSHGSRAGGHRFDSIEPEGMSTNSLLRLSSRALHWESKLLSINPSS